MQQVYSECTCCYCPLGEAEIEKNRKKDNFYYTICDECLQKFTDRLIKIAFDGAE